ncbi:hypothetical protein PAXRUDRAFT_175655 [Paxillus rubicundulus Ve08.2h10]|uniref:HTH CENPB-type domain-containing protein n=1 Tax=Paxillus rubicundulus Ve08.2h10 TaxID=930991 RepID=A0A0D0DB85_9AGAM|nr:hypothetical protein PAXRUDRAFT_175655 [Paxillus rubicundulus Ve08.2h10]
MEWIAHLNACGNAVSKQTICKKVFMLVGKHPGKNWIYHFLARHPDIKLGRPSGLDPKRAQSFNRKTVEDHFTLLGVLMDKYEIPWENVYNMDEKGCQHGGGCGQSRLKYLLSHKRHTHHKLRSSNLELVTIVECVCANG